MMFPPFLNLCRLLVHFLYDILYRYSVSLLFILLELLYLQLTYLVLCKPFFMLNPLETPSQSFLSALVYSCCQPFLYGACIPRLYDKEHILAIFALFHYFLKIGYDSFRPNLIVLGNFFHFFSSKMCHLLMFLQGSELLQGFSFLS